MTQVRDGRVGEGGLKERETESIFVVLVLTHI